MIRDYNNLEYLNTLSIKELEDYYRCYSHHHFNRNKCHVQPSEYKPLTCICKLKSVKHFCNCQEKAKNEPKKNDSIFLCEYIRPSYTSKEDQINDVKKMIIDMKKSKHMLKKVIEDVDNLIEKKKPVDDGLNEVERFYRSEKFIGSSISITTFKNLPRTDIKGGKYIYELCALDDIPIRGNPIFSFKKKPNSSSSLTVIACKDK